MNRRTLITKRRAPAKERSGGGTQIPASAASSASNVGDARRQLIAVEAYFLAERRGFVPGCELDDWLAAEAIIEDRLRGMRARGSSQDVSGHRPGVRHDTATQSNSA